MGDDDDSNVPGMASILRLVGFNVPTRAQFIGEAVVSATLSSMTIGLVCGAAGASMFPFTVGPLVPYMVGSTVGYSFGLWQYWSTCKRNVVWYARHYPTVLAHAILTDRQVVVPLGVVKASQQQLKLLQENEGNVTSEPAETSTPTLEQWILQGGLGRMTWSILAAGQCRANILDIQKQERQRVVDDFLGEESE